MSDELIFEDLPPKATGRSAPVAEWVRQLQGRPGEWARVPIKRAGSAGYYFRKFGIELVTRTVNGEKRIYGRYVGTNGDQP